MDDKRVPMPKGSLACSRCGEMVAMLFPGALCQRCHVKDPYIEPVVVPTCRICGETRKPIRYSLCNRHYYQHRKEKLKGAVR